MTKILRVIFVMGLFQGLLAHPGQFSNAVNMNYDSLPNYCVGGVVTQWSIINPGVHADFLLRVAFERKGSGYKIAKIETHAQAISNAARNKSLVNVWGDSEDDLGLSAGNMATLRKEVKALNSNIRNEYQNETLYGFKIRGTATGSHDTYSVEVYKNKEKKWNGTFLLKCYEDFDVRNFQGIGRPIKLVKEQ